MDQTITAIYDNGILRPRYPLRANDALQLVSALTANAALIAAGLPALTFLWLITACSTRHRPKGWRPTTPTSTPNHQPEIAQTLHKHL